MKGCSSRWRTASKCPMLRLRLRLGWEEERERERKVSSAWRSLRRVRMQDSLIFFIITFILLFFLLSIAKSKPSSNLCMALWHLFLPTSISLCFSPSSSISSNHYTI
uniref:Uncharacterized protein n=1 Tax=Rhizophora mucronata TaxID=61149 RepID=A0A2P2IMJ8_RHIMU